MFHSLGYRDIAQGVQAITQGPDVSHSTKHVYLCFTVTLSAPMLRPLLGSENQAREAGRWRDARPCVSVGSTPPALILTS